MFILKAGKPLNPGKAVDEAGCFSNMAAGDASNKCASTTVVAKKIVDCALDPAQCEKTEDATGCGGTAEMKMVYATAGNRYVTVDNKMG